ncbi:MAG: hypothetical protein OEQ53_16760, partial [Saprospiraceae bacterium]|nr:hypothetical protein [Saprospiraceae bacterium]
RKNDPPVGLLNYVIGIDGKLIAFLLNRNSNRIVESDHRLLRPQTCKSMTGCFGSVAVAQQFITRLAGFRQKRTYERMLQHRQTKDFV